MRRLSHLIPAILVMLASLGFAASTSAQSAQDFTLPPPPPADETEVEGPADDTGIVPVGPRIIPNENANQTPASETAVVEQPTASDTVTAPAAGASPPTGQPQPATNNPPATINLQAPPETSQLPANQVQIFEEPDSTTEPSTSGNPIDFPPILPAQDIPSAETAGTDSDPQWLWWAVGGVLLFLGLGAGFFFWRRSKEQYVPVIERPVVPGQGDQASAIAQDIKVDLDVQVTSLSRSLMTLTLNCRVLAANRSDRAVRDLDICADLTSAHRSVPVEQQMAMPDTELPLRAKVGRIGPHQSHYEQLSLQIPVAELNGFRQGEAALCVPLLRLRIGAPTMDTKTRSYAIGIDPGGAASRLQPLPLHVPPGSYPAARLRALN